MTNLGHPKVYTDRNWQLSLALVLAGLGFAFFAVIQQLVNLWVTKSDYSHGFLVVPFAAYLLWLRRERFPHSIKWPDGRGLIFFGLGTAIFLAAQQLNLAKEWLQACSLVIALAGVVVMFCGRWKGLIWAWPGLFFLIFAFELPFRAERFVSMKLRDLATQGGNFLFQTMGFPSYYEGHTITVGDTVLEVAQACSGLSMLLAFMALSVAMALLATKRPIIDRLIIAASAAPIAIFCNVVRIVVTGLVYHAGWKQFGDLIVHDLAGWLMMPLALALTWLLIRLLDWIIEPIERVSTGEALGIQSHRITASLPPATLRSHSSSSIS